MLKKVISDESGRALILALIALGVGMMLLPTFLAQINTNLFASRSIEVGIEEYYSSDAAIEYTLWQIKCNTEEFLDGLEVGDTKSYTIPIGGSGVVSISLTPLSSAGGSNEVDAMLVMDRSGSMKDADGDGHLGELADIQYDEYGNIDPGGGDWDPEVNDYQPIGDAKVAAKAFVDILEDYSVEGVVSHQVGLVSYANEATLDIGLTTGYPAVRGAIDGMSADGYTGIGDAIGLAALELQTHDRGAVKVIVLLSDGQANVAPNPPPNPPYECSIPCPDEAKQYAEDIADAACQDTEGGINFFTIALGTDTDTDLMQYIARYDQSKADACQPRNGQDPGQTPDFYQESASSEDLEDKFRLIALYLTSPQYTIIATTGDTTIESRVQHQQDEEEGVNRVGIFTWQTR